MDISAQSVTDPPHVPPVTSQVYNRSIFPLLLGIQLGNILLGLNLAQFYYVTGRLYARRETSQVTWTIVLVLLICTIGDTVSKNHYAIKFYEAAILNGMDPYRHTPTSGGIFLGFDLATVFTCHLIYIRRIFRMLPTINIANNISGAGRGTHITILVLILAGCLTIAQVPLGIVTIIRFSEQVPATWIPKVTALFVACIAVTASGDVLLCLTFIYTLKAYKPISRRSINLVDKWISLTVECMILPTLFQVIRLILFQAWPKRAYHYPFTFIATKLYIMAVLVLYTSALKPHGLVQSRMTDIPEMLSVHVTKTIQIHTDEQHEDILSHCRQPIHLNAIQKSESLDKKK